MNQSRSILPLLAGWMCLGLAAIMLAFSILMFFLETSLQTCIAFGCISLFPALIAVACLMPRWRTIALRMIGAVVCLACVGTLIMSFVNPSDTGQPRPRRGMIVVIALATGAMALKGRWPGSEPPENTEPVHLDPLPTPIGEEHSTYKT